MPFDKHMLSPADNLSRSVFLPYMSNVIPCELFTLCIRPTRLECFVPITTVEPMLVRLSIHPWELSWEQFSTKKILLDAL